MCKYIVTYVYIYYIIFNKIHQQISSYIEVGCSEEEVRKLLDKFVSFIKILYDEDNEEIMLLNCYKYNMSANRNILTA
jgi:hypothetical protein